MELTNEEIERYSRQLILSSWSEEKQLVLKKARIAIETNFASAAYYLAAAGAENLCLFGEGTEELAARLQEINSLLKVELKFNTEAKYDFVIGLSTVETQYFASLQNLNCNTEPLRNLQVGALLAADVLAQIKKSRN